MRNPHFPTAHTAGDRPLQFDPPGAEPRLVPAGGLLGWCDRHTSTLTAGVGTLLLVRIAADPLGPELATGIALAAGIVAAALLRRAERRRHRERCTACDHRRRAQNECRCGANAMVMMSGRPTCHRCWSEAGRPNGCDPREAA